MWAYFATRIHLKNVCSLNCFKKILNVKILRWKLCRKAPILSSIWLQSPSPNRSAPSAWAQGPVPNCWGLVRKDYKKAPANDCSRVHRPLCDPEPSNLGDFGPKHICLHPCWTEPVLLLPVLLLALPSLLTDVRLTALQGKNKTKQNNTKQESENKPFLSILVDQSWAHWQW